MNWQPIETAPKDGTAVILGWPRMVRGGYWDSLRSNGRWTTDVGVYTGKYAPTHWMPLPPPPEET